jgi:CxxC motif-containing protein (DUF1111 family)
MKGRKNRWIVVGAAVFALGLAALLRSAIADNPPSFGEPLPNLTAAELAMFDVGKDDFEEVETPADGLGPVFNNTSCAACHSSPAVGGDSNILETRFGRRDHQKFDAMESSGGSLIQSQGIDPDPTSPCAAETVPGDANVVAQRKSTSLLGLGLVDTVPDEALEELAKSQKHESRDVAGDTHKVKDVASGKMRVGRFGWKAQVATLRTFAGDAYLNEMGITNPLFPSENAPRGSSENLAACDTVADPEDDGTGVQNFTNFMTLLAPPPRGPITPGAQAGEAIFKRIGCAVCHQPTLKTGPNTVAALNEVEFHPFSDFLLHDMGSLGDGIEQGRAKGQEMRTAPLWGIRVRTLYLHDGRATTLEGAIVAHDGQGQHARQQYLKLSRPEIDSVIAFLNSL